MLAAPARLPAATPKRACAASTALTLAQQAAHAAGHRAAAEGGEAQGGREAGGLARHAGGASEVERARLQAVEAASQAGGRALSGACTRQVGRQAGMQGKSIPPTGGGQAAAGTAGSRRAWARGAASTRLGRVQVYVSAWRGSAMVRSPCGNEVWSDGCPDGRMQQQAL